MALKPCIRDICLWQIYGLIDKLESIICNLFALNHIIVYTHANVCNSIYSIVLEHMLLITILLYNYADMKIKK